MVKSSLSSSGLIGVSSAFAHSPGHPGPAALRCLGRACGSKSQAHRPAPACSPAGGADARTGSGRADVRSGTLDDRPPALSTASDLESDGNTFDIAPLSRNDGDSRLPVVLVCPGRHHRGAQSRTVLRSCPGITPSTDEMVAFALARSHCFQWPVLAVCGHRRPLGRGGNRLPGTSRMDGACRSSGSLVRVGLGCALCCLDCTMVCPGQTGK